MGKDVQSVLVVDDEPTLLAAARRQLGASYTVLTATDAETALEQARKQRPDVAILDLRLARDSGIDLLRDLKRELPTTTFVLCSGYLSVTTAVAAAQAGAEHVIQKPIGFREIIRRVANDEEEAAVDPAETPSLARVEWDHIGRVLEDCGGNISEAARRLGIYRSSLQRRLRKQAPPK